jgi:ABC-type amino acid transport substrate-binding protein
VAALAALLLAGPLAASPARAGCPPGHPRGEPGDRLRVGFAPAPPFVVSADDDGQVGGLAVEVLRSLARREGWTLELIELGRATLLERVARCELDLGVAGVPESAALAETLDFSQPYFSTVTTAMVHAGDIGRARPAAGGGAGGRFVRAALRGLVWGLLALALLALSSWLLNATSGWSWRRRLLWRRADSEVSGPLAGLRWLWRSTTGRVLAALWVAVGLLLGTTGRTGGAVRPLRLGDDPVRALVEKAAHTDTLVGERYPDGEQISCSADAARACFSGFADGMFDAVAGPREVLCAHILDLALDRAVLRDDLAVPQEYAFLIPQGSPLRLALDRALLRLHEEAGGRAQGTRCPGGGQ